MRETGRDVQDGDDEYGQFTGTDGEEPDVNNAVASSSNALPDVPAAQSQVAESGDDLYGSLVGFSTETGIPVEAGTSSCGRDYGTFHLTFFR